MKMANLYRIKWWLLGLCAVCALVGIALWVSASRPGSLPVALEKITIALPTQPSAGPMFVALAQGLFRKHGLDVTSQVHELGMGGLNSVLENKADLVAVADTPIMFKVMKGEKIAIVCSIANSRRVTAIVARKDRGISNIRDLAGKTIGLTMGSNMQFLVDMTLLANNIPVTAVTTVNLKPDEIVDALQSGRVDAVPAWHPYLAVLQQKMGAGVVSLYGDDMYRFRFNLVGRQDYVATHPATVRKVVAALSEAMQFIRNDPAAAKEIVGKFIHMDKAMLDKVFDPADFELKLDQSLLLALDDQTRWAIKNGLVEGDVVPNYLDYIYFDALQDVKPDAVTMIH